MLLRSRAARAIFLGFTFASTVATSAPPGWQLESAHRRESITLAAGDTVERHLHVSASQHAVVTAVLDPLVARGGSHVHIVLVDSRPGCTDDESYTFYGDRDLVDEGTHYATTVAAASTRCYGSTEDTGADLVVRVENPGTTSMSFTLDVVAKISGTEQEEAPAGAFVDLSDAP